LPTIEEELSERLKDAIETTYPELAGQVAPPEVAIPREEGFGDYSANVALALAKKLKRPPREVAEKLLQALGQGGGLLDQVSIAGPGFLNMTLSRDTLTRSLHDALAQGPRFGASRAGGGTRMQVEFVSANPTGPLNVVNARAAAFGGTLARVLNAAGFDCATEFYVNDVGTQIDLLGESLLARFREAQGLGDAVIPENGYQGVYLADLARDLPDDQVPAGWRDADSRDVAARFSRLAVERILAWQEKDLGEYGTRFDRWFLQSELYPDAVQKTLQEIRGKGFTTEKEGALWLATTRFGDDQDRVLVRSNGEPTYFLADLAYHADKYRRGIRKAIDIWGPDHHGHIPRMQAGMEIMGFGADWLEVIIVQQVNLISGGEPVKMSKRLGEFITLDDLVREVGKDTAIFFFLMRRANSHLDFDLDLAKSTSDENPVYYVKYAHARISSILRVAKERGSAGADHPEAGDPSHLTHPTELALMRLIAQFPDQIRGAALAREPHRLATYVRRLSAAFHPFYHQCRVVGEEAHVAHARLMLCAATRQVIANGLALMNIDAPESM
jgi:arginyl-tRNA synthetase